MTGRGFFRRAGTARTGTVRAGTLLAAAAAVAVAVSGCQFTGFGSSPLPFTPGTGSGTYTVTADLSDVDNLPPNAEVMVNDVTVGTVTAIRFQDWHAVLTISLPDKVKLPANATATIGQKSLLGAEYVALAPPSGKTATGQLTNGDVIPLSRTTAYPSTEDVLTALSTVLNGGGLNQLSTITREMNATLNGHTQQIRELLSNLNTFVDTLNQQRGSIVATLSSVNALSAQIRSQDSTLTNAIDGIPSGLQVLNKNEGNLTQALSALTNLSTVANNVINQSSANLLANLRDLQPAITKLADAGSNLVGSLTVLPTFPFPVPAALHSTRGDYDNVYIILDLTLPTLEKDWLTGLSLPAAANDKPSTKTNNPITTPLKSGSGGSSSSKSGSGSSGPSGSGSGSSGSGSGSSGSGSGSSGSGGSSGSSGGGSSGSGGGGVGCILGSLLGGGC
jgi:phospholipid/cholesterol/gamma-HCH transport system substrate-binding protein